MTNIKTTKRALLSSTLALFLCFAMLLGTTFAWFTDSVTSANNVITAGNLDVNLHYWDNSMGNGTFVAIEDEPDLKLLILSRLQVTIMKKFFGNPMHLVSVNSRLQTKVLLH